MVVDRHTSYRHCYLSGTKPGQMTRKHKKKESKRTLKRIGLGFAFAIIFFVTFSLLAMWRYAWLNRNQPEILGISFSQVQAERNGHDWHDNYLAMLDDLKPRQVRLAAYWDRIEKKPGEYDFSETDWMLDQAKSRNIKVTLVVGQKVIRWPECFYPEWLDRNNPKIVAPAANRFVATTVEHYKNHPALDTWQLENEFLLKVFGKCPVQNLTREQLTAELNTLRAIDAKRPVLLSASNNYGLPILGPFSGTYGFSMYKRVWNPHLGYFTYLYPAWWSWWRASVINLLFAQEIRIHELQAEAWGPVGNEKLSYEESTKSMNPDYLNSIVAWARATKIKRIDLWGVEWWYDQKVRLNHPQMWQAAKKIIQDSRAQNHE